MYFYIFVHLLQGALNNVSYQITSRKFVCLTVSLCLSREISFRLTLLYKQRFIYVQEDFYIQPPSPKGKNSQLPSKNLLIGLLIGN